MINFSTQENGYNIEEVNNYIEMLQQEYENALAWGEEMERKYILQVLDLCNGKISGPGGAAELLGIKRTTLTSKMEKLGIEKSKL